jgi:uncharacterized protein YqfB (UPF0267 family)
VLHVTNTIINTLHVGHLNDEKKDIENITLTEFENKIKEVIYNLEISHFWNLTNN